MNYIWEIYAHTEDGLTVSGDIEATTISDAISKFLSKTNKTVNGKVTILSAEAYEPDEDV